jgi:hypothetical protein
MRLHLICGSAILLPSEPLYFKDIFLFAAIFVSFSLNLFVLRFWCRYLACWRLFSL